MEDINKGVCRNSLTRFNRVFEELSTVNALVIRGEQLVIPKGLQPIVIQLAHEGHMGYEKTLDTLRQSCWFPGMAVMVRKYVESCLPCQAANPKTGQEALKPTMLPDRPWQGVHADFKGTIDKKFYLHTLKLVKKRLENLSVKSRRVTRFMDQEEGDLDVDLDKIRVLSAPNREQSEPRVLSNSNEEEDQGERESEAIPSDQEEGDFFLCSGEET